MPVEHLKDIQFDEVAFEKLVLPPTKKRMISAFVKNAGGAFTGIVSRPHLSSPISVYSPFSQSNVTKQI
jgi:hypothetical protein